MAQPERGRTGPVDPARQTLTGTGVRTEPETDSEAILEGFGIYLRRFPALTKSHHIGVEADGSFNVEDLQLAARQAVIIRVEVNRK